MKNYGTMICESCGKSFKRTGPRQIRCNECAKELNRLRTRQRYREKAAERRLEQERNKTDKKPIEQKPHKHTSECKKNDCIYKATAGGIKICDYLGITGELRGCPVQGCTKYTKGNKRRRRMVMDINKNEFREV